MDTFPGFGKLRKRASSILVQLLATDADDRRLFLAPPRIRVRTDKTAHMPGKIVPSRDSYVRVALDPGRDNNFVVRLNTVVLITVTNFKELNHTRYKHVPSKYLYFLEYIIDVAVIFNCPW
jgi:hypothetical protein